MQIQTYIPDAAALNKGIRYLQRQLRQLSGLLGQEIHSDLDVANAIARGIDASAIGRLVDEGLTRQELQFVIPPRRLSHRIKRGTPLTTAESERCVRIAKLLLLAETLFGDKPAGIAWLRHPKRHFGGKTPLEMAYTEPGGRAVELLIRQAREGYAA